MAKINNFLKNNINENSELVIFCIGTDRSIGDSLGPMVGELLNKRRIIKNSEDVFIYGTIENPIHALNIKEEYVKVKNKHNNPIIIAIDAAIGQEVGQVYTGIGYISPGSALNKDLPKIGDVFIKGLVSDSYLKINSLRLNFIYNLGLEIEDITLKIIKKYKKIKKSV